MYYSKEQINIAKSIDLVEFAKSMNLTIKQERNAYRINDYEGGLYIFEKNQSNTSGFYWHKYNIKGNAIDFCKNVFNDSYTDAIKRLLEFNKGAVYSVDSSHIKSDKQSVYSVDSSKNFVLPERDTNINQAYSYLVKTRKINKELVNECIKCGIIRQFKEKNHVYVGFIGKDINDNPKYLMLRSTLTNSSFKKEYENSSKNYGFKIFNKESVYSIDSKKNIYIFESPIDLLSYMTLNPKKTLENNVFLSMGGVSHVALDQFIADYKPNIGEINICYDNDFKDKINTGQVNAQKLKEELIKKSSVYSIDSKNIHILKPVYKDYNEQLKVIMESREAANQGLNSEMRSINNSQKLSIK